MRSWAGEGNRTLSIPNTPMNKWRLQCKSHCLSFFLNESHTDSMRVSYRFDDEVIDHLVSVRLLNVQELGFGVVRITLRGLLTGLPCLDLCLTRKEIINSSNLSVDTSDCDTFIVGMYGNRIGPSIGGVQILRDGEFNRIDNA